MRIKRPAALLTALATLLGTGGLIAATTPATADEVLTPVVLVGDLQSESGCSDDWTPACEATELTDADADGIYTYTTTVGAGSWQFKIATGGNWDNSYGLNDAAGGDNIPLTLAGDTELTFAFDSANNHISLSTNSLMGEYDADSDSALIADPVRQGTSENFYFVLTDRFWDGDESNNEGGLTGDSLTTGYDPTNKGFYHGGDIQGIIDNLDYIESLGTTAIWLTPSFTNQAVQGEGDDASAGYHGYWITDFTSIDPHLGGNDALAELRDALHERGMKLYLDIITNHTADLIEYEENEYSYVDTATSPYLDADGNVVDISAVANSSDFPQIASSAYTPVRVGDVIPEALNDVNLYHNRGDSTWSGESVTMGDFVGLDDLMTESPVVEQTFEEVYTAWMDFGVDGFRIDTVKHVNFEFWEDFTAGLDEHAAETNSDFFTFGEVYDADATKLSPYSRSTDMDATLDFAFQSSALNYAKGYTTSGLSGLFAADDYYTTSQSSAYDQPTFLGNHDMGRIGYLLASGSGSEETLQRDELAHSLMFLTRGQPVVYYGDEQGYVGVGNGNDKDARQDMFASQVEDVVSQVLVDGSTFGEGDHLDTDSALYQHISELANLRESTPALSDGAQIELAAADNGIYAFARVDGDEKVEYLVALNNSTSEQSTELTTLTPGAAYTPVYGTDTAITADADGKTTVTVPALGAVVLKADRTVADTTGLDDAGISLDLADGASLSGETAEITATVAANRWAETTFSYRVVGSDEWVSLGTAEDDTPRVFADLSGLATGTAIEVRAVTTDASGNLAADSALAVVGVNLAGDADASSGEEVDTSEMVAVPGNHNAAMGCTGDWMPACEQAALTLDEESGLYTGTFTIPAGTYEYKVAIGGSWDENYGANAEAGGANISYTTEGGEITFIYDPSTHLVWNNAEDPVITLPGSFQSALGCESDWAPPCLASVMQPNGDGSWSFSTTDLPGGSYEVKVAHNLSWDENYGVDGAAGGANYSFSVDTGKNVTFTYTMSTHMLDIEVADPPVAGIGQERAYWVDAETLAWPVSMLPDGVDRDAVVSGESELSFSLVTDADGGAAMSEGAVSTDGETLALRVAGDLSDAALEAHPNLEGYIALSLVDADGNSVLDADGVREALTGQLAVVQQEGNLISAFTGVQTAPVLDVLYSDSARQASLGVTFDGGQPSFALWAPTAKNVTLLSWDTGDATGSVSQVDGEAVRTTAVRGDDGVWSVDNADGAITTGSQYLWEVEVYVPETDAVETNQVTDPYSVALTLNSTRSVAVDFSDESLAPQQWAETAAPVVENDASRTIYELHVRDFSAADETVPEELRGTYEAFTVSDSDGMTHLAELADAGVDTIHLLPTFDIATIEEDRSLQAVPDVPADAGAASSEQQAAVTAVADEDAYNWGYDPYHWMTAEGSYATTGNQDGGARVVEFRDMVGALHAIGLQVVLDEVYNHTSSSGQSGDTSVLDKIVPGYYHRLDEKGDVTTSTCCSNVATENAMSEQLMIDSLVWWAREYHVDGFRFDLMGHHSVETMEAARAALDELTLEEDGVDGSSIYLYGEGWNFGEVADNALFTQATQGQLDGTGIGTFNDRLRDAVHGGGPFDSDHRTYQGFGSGEVTDPNGYDDRTQEEQEADLAHRTDLVKLGLAGNLADFSFTTSDGTVKTGAEVDYNGSAAGYASSPEENVNYVDAHDNETLYDLLAFKLPEDTSMADRIRMNTLSLATVALGQSPSFWAAGTELLRSKSLDRDSYNSGDWFNAIDWSMQSNGFGAGLPVESKNGDKWEIMTPLLENENLVPTSEDIATSNDQALDLLRLRSSSSLFSLGDADLIQAKVSFPGSGTDAQAGSLNMLIDDTAAAEGADVVDVDPELDGVLVVFNAGTETLTQTLSEVAGRDFVLSEVQAEGSDEVVKETTFDAATGTVVVPARTVAVLVEAQETVEPVDPEPTVEPTEEPTAEPTTEPTEEPTAEPTVEPTDEPTVTPTEEPTDDPTDEPTDEPTDGNDGHHHGGGFFHWIGHVIRDFFDWFFGGFWRMFGRH